MLIFIDQLLSLTAMGGATTIAPVGWSLSSETIAIKREDSFVRPPEYPAVRKWGGRKKRGRLNTSNGLSDSASP